MTSEERIRSIMMAMEGVTEKLSHGSPSYFYKGKRQICSFVDNHHGNGRTEVWVAAPPGAQEMLIASNPDAFFRPPYVGPSGWVGILLDHQPVDWPYIEGVLAEGYALIQRKVEKKRS